MGWGEGLRPSSCQYLQNDPLIIDFNFDLFFYQCVFYQCFSASYIHLREVGRDSLKNPSPQRSTTGFDTFSALYKMEYSRQSIVSKTKDKVPNAMLRWSQDS